MKKNLLAYSSYEETKENLSNYHKKIKNEVCCNFNLINVSVNPYIALRKNVEIGVFNRPLTDWECEIVTKYGKNNVLEEYHPLLLDYVRQKILPSKSQDYSCDITYFYFFQPFYYKDTIFNFFVTFFDKSIFKNFNSKNSALEQEIVIQISTFFHTQNKYGPEQISVAILDDQFMVIMISGLLTPFLRKLVNGDARNILTIEKVFILQAEIVLEEIYNKHFYGKLYKPLIYFDKNNDKLIILSALSKDKWMDFFNKMVLSL